MSPPGTYLPDCPKLKRSPCSRGLAQRTGRANETHRAVHSVAFGCRLSMRPQPAAAFREPGLLSIITSAAYWPKFRGRVP